MKNADWTKAPSWAEFWALDWDGVAYWYQNKPECPPPHHAWITKCGLVESAGHTGISPNIKIERLSFNLRLKQRPVAE